MESLDMCRFCDIIINNNENDELPIYNRILYQTPSFIVVPALGSLVPGYVMIITKKHIYSMAFVSLNFD